MSAKPQPEVMPHLPRCPHCKKDLEGMAMFQWVTSGWLIICMYCPLCSVALDFGSLPLPPDGGEPSRIQIPS
jgi:hypothetical protein